MQTLIVPAVRPKAGWYPSDPNRIVTPMTLIVSLQTADNKIVLAADSLNLTPTDALGDDRDNYCFARNKIHPVEHTRWVLVNAGSSSMGSFNKQLEAEVELGMRPAFDPHIEIGGPAYLNTLIQIAITAGTPEKPMPPSPTFLAGFDIHGKSHVLVANPPMLGYSEAQSIHPLGAQETTAFWIMRILGSSCSDLEDVKRLAYFTIWQISKQDVRVGNPAAGYPISLCVMSSDSPAQFEELSTVPQWMSDWEHNLQECFVTTLRAREKGESVTS